MKRQLRSVLLLSATIIISLSAAGFAGAQEYSHARIVRLSYVEGNVTVQRPDVPEWAEAPVNTPIQEGFKLSTGDNSFAEVEFENGSTIRLGQLTSMEFTQLALMPNGAKINRLGLKQGYATFHALPENGGTYEVATPDGTLTPRDASLFRVDLDEGIERVEVFKGQLEVSSNVGSWTLAKNAVLELRPGSDEPYTLSEGITKDAWDNWVGERENQVEMAARNAPSPTVYSNNVSDLYYGWNDLSMYGMWSYMPGWGYGWIPTAATYGWTPYGYGRWCWYPGWGYTWISAEPWGWLPYHYGQWSYVSSVGWAWFPGNFGYWSPGAVTWYSGPGWIGWVPQGGSMGWRAGHGCGPTERCGTAIPTGAFQNGGLVTPGTGLAVNPYQGNRVERPQIPPKITAMLPGPVAPQAGASSGTEMRVRRISGTAPAASAGSTALAVAGASSRGRVLTTRGRVGVAAPDSSVVFDPVEGRYVNSNRAPSTSVVTPGSLPSRATPSAVPVHTVTTGPGQPSAMTGSSGPAANGPAQTGVRSVTRPAPVGSAGTGSGDVSGASTGRSAGAPAQVGRSAASAPAPSSREAAPAPSRPAIAPAPEAPRSAPAPREPSRGGAWSGSSTSAGPRSSGEINRGGGGFGGGTGRSGGGGSQGGVSSGGGMGGGGGAGRTGGGTRAGSPRH